MRICPLEASKLSFGSLQACWYSNLRDAEMGPTALVNCFTGISDQYVTFLVAVYECSTI